MWIKVTVAVLGSLAVSCAPGSVKPSESVDPSNSGIPFTVEEIDVIAFFNSSISSQNKDPDASALDPQFPEQRTELISPKAVTELGVDLWLPEYLPVGFRLIDSEYFEMAGEQWFEILYLGPQSVQLRLSSHPFGVHPKAERGFVDSILVNESEAYLVRGSLIVLQGSNGREVTWEEAARTELYFRIDGRIFGLSVNKPSVLSSTDLVAIAESLSPVGELLE